MLLLKKLLYHCVPCWCESTSFWKERRLTPKSFQFYIELEVEHTVIPAKQQILDWRKSTADAAGPPNGNPLKWCLLSSARQTLVLTQKLP